MRRLIFYCILLTLAWPAMGAGGAGNSCHDAASKGRYKQALEACSRLVKTSRDSHALALAFNSRARAHAHLGNLKQAVADSSRAIELMPQFGLAYRNRGNAYLGLKMCGKAISDYQITVDLMPGSADGYNNLAWVLATCPEAAYRDGARAVRLMEKALTMEQDAGLWDTMAAALAEKGDFEKAVASQKKALALLADQTTSAAQSMQRRLQSYQAHKPWRAMAIDWTP